MANIAETLNNPGEISWDVMTLLNINNVRLDILMMCSEVHLYEDIFSNSMHGWAWVVDTIGMIDAFPIVGQEELYIKYHTPATKFSMDKKFRVTGVTNRKIIGNKQTYKMHFIGYDAYVDLTGKEQRAFLGTADTIIPDILKSVNTQSNKISSTQVVVKLNIGKLRAKNRMKFVSPSWSPFKCINYVASSAISTTYNVADYLFFENRDGYQFKSLTEIFSEPVSDIFKYDASVGSINGTDNIIELMAKIKNLEFIQNSDQLQRFLHSGYGTKTISHDLMSKTINVEPLYSPKNEQYKIPMLNNFDGVIVSDKEFTAFKSNFNFQISVSNSLAHNEITTDNNGIVTNTRQLMLSRLGFTELNVEIWGRSWLTVGDVVWVQLGSYTEKLNDTDKQESSASSGKYLVSAIHHILAPLQHKIIMQLVKESTIEKTAAK